MRERLCEWLNDLVIDWAVTIYGLTEKLTKFDKMHTTHELWVGESDLTINQPCMQENEAFSPHLFLLFF